MKKQLLKLKNYLLDKMTSILFLSLVEFLIFLDFLLIGTENVENLIKRWINLLKTKIKIKLAKKSQKNLVHI